MPDLRVIPGARRPVLTGGHIHATRSWLDERTKLLREIRRLLESRARCPSKETDRLLAKAEDALAAFDRREPPDPAA